MRDYGKVYTRFWLKQNVLSWSDSAKLLGLYLLTCPHCNLLGCFRLPIGYVASDLNWDEQQVAKVPDSLRGIWLDFDSKLSEAQPNRKPKPR